MADFVDEKTKELYFEFLENETMMPYDYIEKAVYDFTHHTEMMRKFSKWRLNNKVDLPFE